MTILDVALNSASDGVLVVDAGGAILFFNLAAQRILALPPWDNLAKRPPGIEVFRGDMKTPLSPEESALRGALEGEPQDAVERFVRTPGRPDGFWIEVSAQPLRLPEAEGKGAVLVFRDVSKRKERERALGELTGGIAHEINTPLAVILGWASVLRKRLAAGEIERSELVTTIGKIEATAKRIGRIVKSLKNFSRRSDADPFERVSLAVVIDETLDLCREKVRASNALLKYDPPPATLTLECRPTEIGQVVLNLMSNACDAVREQPEPWIAIVVEDRGSLIHVSVTDNGSGVPEAIRGRILDPFFTTKGPNEGTGLGLSISRRLVGSHGGRLFLDAKAPFTRFVVELPKQQSDLSNKQ